MEEADALARRHAARYGDGDTLNVMLRNDYRRAMTRRREV